MMVGGGKMEGMGWDTMMEWYMGSGSSVVAAYLLGMFRAFRDTQWEI